MWIHEQENWPDFYWSLEKLSMKLADARHHQGRLLGKMETLGFELRQEASLNTLTKDIVKSSVIEGEDLNPDEVRSSIARRFGIDMAGLVPSSRHVEGIVEMMLDATQKYSKNLQRSVCSIGMQLFFRQEEVVCTKQPLGIGAKRKPGLCKWFPGQLSGKRFTLRRLSQRDWKVK